MTPRTATSLSRRGFLARGGLALGAGWLAATPGLAAARRRSKSNAGLGSEARFDLVICGGGLGGIAAALAACRAGLRVVLTEETDWVGGQLTAQAVPPDEHRWIEQHGCTRTYRQLRDGIRDYYRRHYPLTAATGVQGPLNPGLGAVSRLCHEPRVALAVLEAMIQPHVSSGRLTVLREHWPVRAEVDGDRVRAVTVRGGRTGRDLVLEAGWFIDATELGDLLPLAGVEHVTGAEARAETGEMHAAERADPANQQAFTVCFAIDHEAGAEHVIERPRHYGFWREYVPRLAPPWPGRLLDLTYTHPRTGEPRTTAFDPTRDGTGDGRFNLWVYRRITAARMFEPGTYAGDISLINWPQNDYLGGNLVGVSRREAARHVEAAKQLSLSLLYWLQTEVPRPDGGQGWPGLRLRGDLVGTTDGLAKSPYVREARRIRALYTIREQDCGVAARAELLGRPETEVRAASYHDTVGIGHYAIDLHPTTTGDNYIDFEALPFQVPLGALLPVRVGNLLPACKNIGTTHVTNGAYRLHPVEWNIGEAVGALVAFAARRREPARAVRENAVLLGEFQDWIRGQGIETHWPS